MSGDFVSLAVQLLHSRIVGVFVRDEESGFDVAAVGVLAFAVEDLLVDFDVVVVDGIIEADHDHLRYLLGVELAGDLGTGLRAEAVGQDADGRVAWWGAVRILVEVYCQRQQPNRQE